MIGWIIFGLYMLGFLPVWRRAAWLVAHDVAYGRPEGGDVVLGLFVGAVASVVWPVLVLGYFLCKLSPDGDGFLKEPKRRKTQDEKIADLEQENRRLERELEIVR